MALSDPYGTCIGWPLRAKGHTGEADYVIVFSHAEGPYNATTFGACNACTTGLRSGKADFIMNGTISFVGTREAYFADAARKEEADA